MMPLSGLVGNGALGTLSMGLYDGFLVSDVATSSWKNSVADTV
jgi:hypothetical protein